MPKILNRSEDTQTALTYADQSSESDYWIVKKTKSALRCCKEKGLWYTIALFFKKVWQKIMPSAPPIVRDYDFYKGLRPSKYPKELMLWYNKKTERLLDLGNPRTFNEKIQWLKLYDSTPQKSMLTDKYRVRGWIKEKIGERYLTQLYGVWDRFDDIDFGTLPNSFVLKANHGCGWNIIVREKSSLNIGDAKNKFDKWLATNFAFRNGLELQYKSIVPKIIAEEYLENADGDLYDYKVWCFDGKPQYIMVVAERRTGLKVAYYDTHWKRMPEFYSYPVYEQEVPRPDNLEELLMVSEELGKGFPHVRVDFYRLDDGSLKFGEMTFTPYSGACKWPHEFDLMFGELITLPDTHGLRNRRFK